MVLCYAYWPQHMAFLFSVLIFSISEPWGVFVLPLIFIFIYFIWQLCAYERACSWKIEHYSFWVSRNTHKAFFFLCRPRPPFLWRFFFSFFSVSKFHIVIGARCIQKAFRYFWYCRWYISKIVETIDLSGTCLVVVDSR